MRVVQRVLILIMALALSGLFACAGQAGSNDAGADGQEDGADADAGDGSDAGGDGDGEPRPDPALRLACADETATIYAAQADPSDARGQVVACALDEAADVAAVTARLAHVPGLEIRSGYQAYRLAYRTEREPGLAGTGTARLLVPDAPRAGPRPVVVATHGTAGLADVCAPSRALPNEGQDALILPWLAAGYVVVAPDYAGLGNAGVQGYGHHADTAHSVIDAGRAALSALVTGSVDRSLVVAGHSQGGVAALEAQAFGRPYGAPDVSLLAVVAYAGSLSENRSLAGWLYPQLVPLAGGAGVTRAVVALAFYADFANLFGEERAGEVYHPDLRDHVVGAIRSNCVYGLVDALSSPATGYTVPLTAADLVDPDLQQEVADCLQENDCSARAAAYVERVEANEALPDAAGAPVLMIGGGDDLQSPPEKQACTRDYLLAHGVEPATCLYPGEEHQTIVAASAEFALRWVAAVLAGVSAPECPHELALPACP